jgi:hypothetical protein
MEETLKKGGAMNFPMTPMFVKAYQDSLLADAQTQRQLRVARSPSTALPARLLARVGSRLVAAGLWLQTRYTPTVAPAAKA